MKRRRGKPPAPPVKPGACPFCGLKAGKLSAWRERDEEPMIFVVDCDACSANGPVMGGNAARAKVAWNHRGGPADTFTPENRGVPEVAYGVETLEEKEEREEAGQDPARPVKNPKPCPWCSSLDIYVEEQKVGKGKKATVYFYCFCATCEAVGPTEDTRAGFAVLAWNKRA